jgi:outer membrane receptor for ferrienterochelin and colicin
MRFVVSTTSVSPSHQPTESPKYEDQVIVTASRVEQKLVNAPATVSLISAQTIASAPSASYAELMRGVPGMNVTQTSARDLNLVSPSATRPPSPRTRGR